MMRSLVLNTLGVVTMLACAALVNAQTANMPGQIASSSEAPAFALPANISSSNGVPISSQKLYIANIESKRDLTMKRLWLTSICAMLGASGMDAATSWGKYEKNSLLASSDGRFGVRGVSMKAAFAGAVILPQILLRRHKDLRMKLAIGNFAEAAVFTGISVHNMGIASPKN
jgi:hypothetical protein